MPLGFSFNGVHCSDYGLQVTYIKRPGHPTVRDQYTEIPGMDGSLFSAGPLSDQNVEIGCQIIATDIFDLRHKIRLMTGWLYTVEQQQLVCDDEPGIAYRGKVASQFIPDEVLRVGKFAIVFRCEPTAYGDLVQADFAGDTVTVSNGGTYKAWPVFRAEIIAACTEWRVALGADYVRIVHDFVVGDTIDIDCATGVVSVNGLRAMDKLDWEHNADEFTLPPGESTLSILPTGVSTANISYIERWV
jgi:predicted phage tail component-like protein